MPATSADCDSTRSRRVPAGGFVNIHVVPTRGGAGPIPGLPLFVLTHRVPSQVPVGDPGYTFVTDGIRSAVERARAVANGRDLFVMGADTVQQCLRAGLLDEIVVNLVPVLLGRGVRLLDRLEPPVPRPACTGVVDAPGVTHLTYRVTYR